MHRCLTMQNVFQENVQFRCFETLRPIYFCSRGTSNIEQVSERNLFPRPEIASSLRMLSGSFTKQ
jgi:hypothetical protein